MMHLISPERPLTVLLIEDNKGDAILIKRTLKNAMMGAVEAEWVTSLEEALNALEAKEFDVALLDRSLPDVDDFTGLHSIQSFVPKLPVIFLTAYQDERTAFQAIEQGAQDYLFKDRMDGHTIKRAVQYAILRKQFEGILTLRANFDALTGLANRMLFESRLDMALARMKRQGGNLAVLFIDLDRFKQVNDTLGHAAGDLVLKEVAARLCKVLRPYDTAARFGGDEFAILLEGMPEKKHAEVVLRKIHEALKLPFTVKGKEVVIGASIGVAACEAEAGISSGDELIQQADAAMYAGKVDEPVSEEHYRVAQ